MRNYISAGINYLSNFLLILEVSDELGTDGFDRLGRGRVLGDVGGHVKACQDQSTRN